MKHEITGDRSCEISAFKLPVTDQDTERRNFPGYQTHTLTESMMEEISEQGTTDTRSGKK